MEFEGEAFVLLQHLGRITERLGNGCLNIELLWSLEDARDKLEKWRMDYNHHRSHSSLANLLPSAFTNELFNTEHQTKYEYPQ